MEDYSAIFSSLKNKLKLQDYTTASCPFHEDSHNSFSFKSDGLWKCHCPSCAGYSGGNHITFLKAMGISPKKYLEENGYQIETPKTIPVEVVLSAKRRLQNNQEKIQELQERFGWSDEVIRKYNIGISENEQEILFPIDNEFGDIVNIRRYNYDKIDGKPKWMSHAKGMGGNAIFPLQEIPDQNVYLVAGEKDCLLMRSKGYNAFTFTAGEGSYSKKYDYKFRNRPVVIIYDDDQAGIDGAIKVATSMYGLTSQIKIIKLETGIQGGDITDYFVKLGKTKDELDVLVSDSSVFTLEDQDFFPVTVGEAVKSCYTGKKLKLRIQVASSDDMPFVVPMKTKFTCGGECCSKAVKINGFCSLKYIEPKEIIWQTSKGDQELLKLILVNQSAQAKTLLKIAKIKDSCPFVCMEQLEMENMNGYSIVQDIGYFSDASDEMRANGSAARRAFSHRTDLQPNASYLAEAVMYPDPTTQEAVILINSLSEIDSSGNYFKVTPEIKTKLEKFQVAEETVEGLDAKLKDIYKEFENDSGIWGRTDLMLGYDLSFHSARKFSMDGKTLPKGWVELSVIGDPATGKSSLGKFFTRKYGCGDFISGESVTIPGLIGACVMGRSKKLVVEWGAFILNHGKIVIVDEAQGISRDQFSQMSEMRSSGMAKINKAAKGRAMCQTRKVWLSNPRRDNHGISTMASPVELIMELFGKPEDVRRLDMALIIANKQTDKDCYSRSQVDMIYKYTSDLCHDLIMYAWSRREADIIIPADVSTYIKSEAEKLSSKFSIRIPLIEPAEARHKVARLAVAIANRTYSCDSSGEKTVVKKFHVDYVCRMLNRIYSSDDMKFSHYSKRKEVMDAPSFYTDKAANELFNNIFFNMSRAAEFSWTTVMLEKFEAVNTFSKSDLEGIMCFSRDENREFNLLFQRMLAGRLVEPILSEGDMNQRRVGYGLFSKTNAFRSWLIKKRDELEKDELNEVTMMGVD